MATKKFKCNVCGYIHEGDAAPANCPVCGVPASEFTELKQEKKGLFSDKNGNAYIIMYSTVMVVVVAVLLAVAALALKPRQDANDLNEKKQNILASLSALDKSYDEYIDAYVVDKEGKRIEGEEVFALLNDLPDFIGENGHFSTIFDFSAHMLSDGEHGWYDAPPISFNAWKKAITDSQMRVQNVGFEANIIENHDEPRGVSRFLPDYAQNADGAKMLGTVSVLLRGIPFIYQGQEIGMQNARWNSVDEFDDISTKDQYRVAREAGLSDAEALAVCSAMSRDNARTPMQWKDAPQAGFTSGTPWLKVNDNYPVINVEKEEGQPDSVLHYYRKLIALRKSGEYRELFTYGKFEPAYENADHVMAYYRILQGRRVLVAANFGTDTIELDWEVPAKKVLLSNEKRTNAENKLILEKCEVFVTECK